MATTLANIVCQCKLAAKLSNTVQGQTVTVNAEQATFSCSLTSGTTANKADLFYVEVDKTLSSASTHDLDVYDMAVFDQTTDLLGNTVTFTEIVAVAVQNESGSAGNLVLGGNGTTAAWNSIFGGSDDDAAITIHPGGFFMIAAPDDPAYAVADTTNHLLRVTASGGDITYNIAIIGRSA